MVCSKGTVACKRIQSRWRRLQVKGVKHYFKDGTEHKGGTHKMPNGELHSNKTHTKTSKRLFHFGELSTTAQKKAKSKWR